MMTFSSHQMTDCPKFGNTLDKKTLTCHLLPSPHTKPTIDEILQIGGSSFHEIAN